MARRQPANVVRVIQSGDLRDRTQRRAIHEVDPPGAAIRDHEAILVGRVQDALRLAQAADRPAAIVLGIDHLDGVVAQSSDEQPVARRVGSKMINASLDVGHGNRGQQLESRGRRDRIGTRQCKRPEEQCMQCV